MDKRLIQAGTIAIPLKNSNDKIFPHPNFLVVDNVFGKMEAEIPGMGVLVCQQTSYKIVYREILPEALGRQEEMREISYENANQPVPAMLVPALLDYNYMKAGLDNLDLMLALFQFRGSLSELKLAVDRDALDEILKPEVVNEGMRE